MISAVEEEIEQQRGMEVKGQGQVCGAAILNRMGWLASLRRGPLCSDLLGVSVSML